MSKSSMTEKEFKTMVVVKLEMLRGCCNTSSIKKAQIAQSISEFISKISKIEINPTEQKESQ